MPITYLTYLKIKPHISKIVEYFEVTSRGNKMSWYKKPKTKKENT